MKSGAGGGQKIKIYTRQLNSKQLNAIQTIYQRVV